MISHGQSDLDVLVSLTTVMVLHQVDIETSQVAIHISDWLYGGAKTHRVTTLLDELVCEAWLVAAKIKQL